MYDDRILSQWDEKDPEKFNRLWEWFDEVESVDLDTEALTSTIKTKYAEQ